MKVLSVEIKYDILNILEDVNADSSDFVLYCVEVLVSDLLDSAKGLTYRKAKYIGL